MLLELLLFRRLSQVTKIVIDMLDTVLDGQPLAAGLEHNATRQGVKESVASSCVNFVHDSARREGNRAPIATTSVSPCRTRPSASAANSQVSEPVSRSASHPPAMA